MRLEPRQRKPLNRLELQLSLARPLRVKPSENPDRALRLTLCTGESGDWPRNGPIATGRLAVQDKPDRPERQIDRHTDRQADRQTD